MSLVNVQAGEVTAKHVSANVMVGDREYYLFVTPSYVTVVYGPPSRRKLGKTFWTDNETVANYKRDGQTLGDVIAELRKMISDWQNLEPAYA